MSLLSGPGTDPAPARAPCGSPQVPGDTFCPGLDGLPVAEVSFRRPQRLRHHPFRERQFVVVEDSESLKMLVDSLALFQELGIDCIS